LIYGGETTVTIKGSPGKGGRNQELILAAAVELHRLGAQKQIAFASFGTDGIDGASDAAGAICTGETIHRARKAGLNPRKLLTDHDSHHFFKTLNDLIITGQTGTNVADVIVAIHSAPQKRRRTAPTTRSEKSVR
ncbi:MOFRL family protein, partial [Geitlerinema calcuttense]